MNAHGMDLEANRTPQPVLPEFQANSEDNSGTFPLGLTPGAVSAAPAQEVDEQVGIAEDGVDNEGIVVRWRLGAVDFVVAVGGRA